MAQEISNHIGGISPDELLRLRPHEHVLLMESKLIRCLQVRHYDDQMFGGRDRRRQKPSAKALSCATCKAGSINCARNDSPYGYHDIPLCSYSSAGSTVSRL
jgi:hypothetical protein